MSTQTLIRPGAGTPESAVTAVIPAAPDLAAAVDAFLAHAGSTVHQHVDNGDGLCRGCWLMFRLVPTPCVYAQWGAAALAFGREQLLTAANAGRPNVMYRPAVQP